MKKKKTGPLGYRICDCGCGCQFQPVNTRHIYKEGHANFGYNHGTRKERQKNQTIIEKILRRNDRVCSKYYDDENNESICILEAAIKDGLNLSYTIGQSPINGIIYYHTYNFRFHLFMDGEIKKIKIIE